MIVRWFDAVFSDASVIGCSFCWFVDDQTQFLMIVGDLTQCLLDWIQFSLNFRWLDVAFADLSLIGCSVRWLFCPLGPSSNEFSKGKIVFSKTQSFAFWHIAELSTQNLVETTCRDSPHLDLLVNISDNGMYAFSWNLLYPFGNLKIGKVKEALVFLKTTRVITMDFSVVEIVPTSRYIF